jgi:electron transport complex protein RnfB
MLVLEGVLMAHEKLREARLNRISKRERDNPKWRNPPLRIEKWECITCDSCLRECPPQFGAIFNDGIDVKIVPELCSGCNRCLRVCPVGCIYPDPEWSPTAEDLWQYPGTGADPYLNIREFEIGRS